jgi:myo-inositol-1(or 4)-monophosphatase
MDLVQNWVIEAAKMALSWSANRRVDLKPDLTPVTQIDKNVESFLLEQIVRHYPEHSVLAEEGSYRTGEDFTWIIDPIDGTRAFASGLPIWGISVGVFQRGEPYAGVFYMPVTGELHWGTREHAFYNKQRLVPSSTVDLNSPLAFIAVPSSAHLYFEISFPRLRSLGSATAHLAYVARGVATAALTRRIRIWDVAAILPLFMISQTQLMYLSGKPFRPSDLLHGEMAAEPLIAAHSSIIDEVRGIVHLRRDDPIEDLSA